MAQEASRFALLVAERRRSVGAYRPGLRRVDPRAIDQRMIRVGERDEVYELDVVGDELVRPARAVYARPAVRRVLTPAPTLGDALRAASRAAMELLPSAWHWWTAIAIVGLVVWLGMLVVDATMGPAAR